jgi:hypothetical protein
LKSLVFLPLSLVALPAAHAAEDWQNHVPAGWKLIGDVADADAAVLMIEQDDLARRVKNSGLGPDELNTNPRRLVFLSRTSAGYKRTGSADRFLPPEGDSDTPCLADPLEEGGMDLRDNVLTLNLNYWLSCGSWSTSKDSFKFRLENGRFRLIGFDRRSYARNGGTGEEISINYLTNRKKMTTDIEIFEPEADAPTTKQKVVWTRIGRQKYYLDAMDRKQCDGDESAPSWCGY